MQVQPRCAPDARCARLIKQKGPREWSVQRVHAKRRGGAADSRVELAARLCLRAGLGEGGTAGHVARGADVAAVLEERARARRLRHAAAPPGAKANESEAKF
eukprot:4500633-Pleurochrysis_carterae.AAC.3